MSAWRAIHFVNQFFAGIGGEAEADAPVGVRPGAVGPGIALEAQWKGQAKIAATVYCGDNYFQAHADEVIDRVRQVASAEKAAVVLAGPAFDAGRYGFACASVCAALAREPGIVAVTGMFPENPGADVYRTEKPERMLLVPTAKTVTGMAPALARMATIALRATSGTTLGSPAEEGYLPRGIRTPVVVDRRGARRAVDMILAKVQGRPIETETPLGSYVVVPPAPPLRRLAGARLAVVTTSGVAPKGNPDRFKTHVNTRWAKYPIEGLERLEPGQWQAIHGGYNTEFMNTNPNFGVPLDALRALQREGVFGELHPYYYVVPGNQVQVSDAHRMAAEMAAELGAGGVEGVLLVAT
jgi:glycine reductase